MANTIGHEIEVENSLFGGVGGDGLGYVRLV
jgi:hypothetical protein